MRGNAKLAVLLGLAVSLGACSMATISTCEVDVDGSYVSRDARTVQMLQDTISGFSTRWEDQTASGTFTDETKFDREESSDPGADAINQLIGLVEKMWMKQLTAGIAP